MEGLTRLVTESLARHGFDRPLDYRRLHWSRWFRCDSHHSLLIVPSKPGLFAVAEEIMDLDPRKPSAGTVEEQPFRACAEPVEGAASVAQGGTAAVAAEATNGSHDKSRRMLAVTQFFEDDDMAFVLDRMLSRRNVMSSRLTSGRYFVRFVVVEDQTQRRSICAALNQWIVSAAEKATGIGSHFASSLELTPATEYIPAADDAQGSLFDKPRFENPTNVGRTLLSTNADTVTTHPPAASPQLDSGAATNIHCPTPLPSGF
jgi:hypothetical protein